MCGLWGVLSTTLSKVEIEDAFTLGHISSLRGLDSTGVTFGYKKGKKHMYYTTKSVDNSASFLASEKLGKAMEGKSPFHVIMGHCRAATVGSITEENAHPFVVGSVIGAHNGTVNHFGNKTEDISDSRDLFQRLDRKGLNQTVQEIEDGAFALTWVDLQDDTFNIIRNSQRPLFMMPAKGGGTVYYASERSFLDLVNARSNTVFDTIQVIEPYTHYKFEMGYHPMNHLTKTKVEEPKRKATFHNWGKHGSYTPRGGCYSNGDDAEWEEFFGNNMPVANNTGSALPASCLLPPPNKSTNPEVLHQGKLEMLRKIDGVDRILRFRGFNSLILPTKAENLLACGCTECKTAQTLRQQVYWHSPTEYICFKCHQDASIRDLYEEYYMFPSGRKLVKGQYCYVTLDKVNVHDNSNGDDVQCH